ncbi:MAG: hypothetical protein Q9M91_01980 [Candidatus Dojkabacteria bacterium]|nr:hypothetical protein [Candidatus Dojkabacteria bacterium]
MEKGDKKRERITKNYINLISNSVNNELVIIKDIDILERLTQERDNMLEEIGITIEELALPISKRQESLSGKEMVHEYINDYSKIWVLYTDKYLEILKEIGVVGNETVLIYEPWQHFRLDENESGKIFLDKLPISKEVRKPEDNSSIGYIAYDFNFNQSIEPSLNNLELFISKLKEEANTLQLDIHNSLIFETALNFFPLVKINNYLNTIIEEKNNFYVKRESLKEDISEFNRIKSITLKRIRETAELLVKELVINLELVLLD